MLVGCLFVAIVAFCNSVLLPVAFGTEVDIIVSDVLDSTTFTVNKNIVAGPTSISAALRYQFNPATSSTQLGIVGPNGIPELKFAGVTFFSDPLAPIPFFPTLWASNPGGSSPLIRSSLAMFTSVDTAPANAGPFSIVDPYVDDPLSSADIRGLSAMIKRSNGDINFYGAVGPIEIHKFQLSTGGVPFYEASARSGLTAMAIDVALVPRREALNRLEYVAWTDVQGKAFIGTSNGLQPAVEILGLPSSESMTLKGITYDFDLDRVLLIVYDASLEMNPEKRGYIYEASISEILSAGVASLFSIQPIIKPEGIAWVSSNDNGSNSTIYVTGQKLTGGTITAFDSSGLSFTEIVSDINAGSPNGPLGDIVGSNFFETAAVPELPPNFATAFAFLFSGFVLWLRRRLA